MATNPIGVNIMKKNLLKFLFLSLFSGSFYFNISAADDDNIIPEYTIEAPWQINSVDNAKNLPANNHDYIMPVGGSGDLSSDCDVNEINNLNLNYDDLANEPSLLAKIKSKLPNLNISKEQLQKIIRIAAAASAACVASYVGCKIIRATADTVKNIVVETCKSVAVLAVLVLIAKYATGR